MFETIIGASTGWGKINYNWRDMALYALAVGADEEDLIYTYEKGMKALPSFGVLPLFNNVNCEPQRPDVYSGFFLARDLMSREVGHELLSGLHMWHEIVMEKPFDPIKGTMVFEQKISNLYNWGEKGVVVELEIPVYDESGQLICRNRSMTAMPTGPIYQGEAMPNTKVEFPDREADVTVDSYIGRAQNALYRLTGDTTPTHIDPEQAKKYADRVFMQGLCTFGYACRMAIRAAALENPDRVKKVAMQLRSMAFPDTPVQLKLWKTKEKEAHFRLFDMNTGKLLVDHGVLTWN